LDIGWLDYGARMYQPDLGRWGAIDPLSEIYAPLSPYNYVGNSPVGLVDPDGMAVTVSFVGDNSKEARKLFAQVINQILGGQFEVTLTAQKKNGKDTGKYTLGLKDAESLGKDKNGKQIEGDVSKLSAGGQEFYARLKSMT